MSPHQAPHVPDIAPDRNKTNAHPSTPILDPVEPDGGSLDALELETPDEAFAFLIPAGTHPRDRSIAVDDLEHYSDNPVHHDTAGDRYTTGRKAFATDNGQAFAVFERAASDFNAGAISITANTGGTSIVVGRVLGRKSDLVDESGRRVGGSERCPHRPDRRRVASRRRCPAQPRRLDHD